jgi:MFS family permease
MLAYTAFVQSTFGPVMPFLRNELNLSYTAGGLLPAAGASGLILSGIAGGWLARTWGRRVVFWSGSVCLALSAILLGLSHQFAALIVAALGIGFSSSLTQVMIQALLSDQHGEQRSIALTEANVAASLSTTLTPLVIGGLIGAGISWRAIAILVIVFLSIIGSVFHRQTIPNSNALPVRSDSNEKKLPASFWRYWTVLFLFVCAEMSIAVWGTEFFVGAVGLDRASAALAFGAFPAAMFIGRLLGSRLTRYWSTVPLLIMALGITFIGFPLFWLSRFPALNILGLFVTGLGIANHYPLTLALAVGAAGEHTNEASARASLAVGIALLIMPLLLGQMADQLGIQSAYGIVIVLLVVASVVVIGNYRQTRRQVAAEL